MNFGEAVRPRERESGNQDRPLMILIANDKLAAINDFMDIFVQPLT